MHTDDKPYTCDVCEYASKSKYDVVRHKRKHTGEKLYNVMFVHLHVHRKEIYSDTIEYTLVRNHINVISVNMNVQIKLVRNLINVMFVRLRVDKR